MSERWAVRLPADDAAALGRLRLVPGLEVCRHEEAVWLRGAQLDEDLEHALRALPGARRFAVLDDDQLLPVGALVPRGRLPEGPWTAIADWMSVAIESAGFAAVVDERVALRLVRSDAPEPAGVLVAAMDDWLDWAATAPQVRLNRLAFAAGADGSVVVRGTPLPPIRGIRYAERHGVAVEVGWTWQPAVDAEVLARLFEIEQGELVLLERDGSWNRIRAEQFVRATRSAVRMTAGGTSDE